MTNGTGVGDRLAGPLPQSTVPYVTISLINVIINLQFTFYGETHLQKVDKLTNLHQDSKMKCLKQLAKIYLAIN